MSKWLRPLRRAKAAAQWRTMRRRVRADQADRERRVAGREAFVADVEALLFRHDPIGLDFGGNTDEYRGEAESITILLPDAADESDAQRMIHDVFVRWFDPEMAGPIENYAKIAQEVWRLHQTQHP